MFGWLARALRAIGCNRIDTALCQHEKANDHDDRAADEHELVPTALVGQDRLNRNL